MPRHRTIIGFVLAGFLLNPVLFAPAPLAATPAERLAAFESRYARTGETVHCIATRRIREVRVLDDQHVLFRLGANRFVLNRLPHRCARLGNRRSFAYTSLGGRLCAVDTITVLDTASIGVPAISHGGRLHGFFAGPRCGLGQFELLLPTNVP